MYFGLLQLSCVALSALAAWVILSPHLGAQVEESDQLNEHQADLEDRVERQKQLLSDLELDYSTDKLAEAEYKRLKLEIERELVQALEKRDKSK